MNKADIKYTIHLCPDSVLMKSYLDGSLDSEVRTLVDLHIKECPFCSDAVEGLTMLDSSRVSHLTDELNQKIDNRLKKDSGKFYWYTAAAILIVALISGFLIFQLSDLRKERNITDVSNERRQSPEVIVPPADTNSGDDQKTFEEEPVQQAQERSIQSNKQEISVEDLPQVDLPEIAEYADNVESISSGAVEYDNHDSDLKREVVADLESSEVKEKDYKDKFIEPTTISLSKATPAPAQNSSAGMTDSRVAATAEDNGNLKVAEEESNESIFSLTTKNKQENTAKKSAAKESLSAKLIEKLYFENKYEEVIKQSDDIERFTKADRDKVLWLRAHSFHALDKIADAISVLNILESYQNKYTTEASQLRVTLQQLNQEK